MDEAVQLADYFWLVLNRSLFPLLSPPLLHFQGQPSHLALSDRGYCLSPHSGSAGHLDHRSVPERKRKTLAPEKIKYGDRSILQRSWNRTAEIVLWVFP